MTPYIAQQRLEFSSFLVTFILNKIGHCVAVRNKLLTSVLVKRYNF
ncbi:MAG: hypothetical protein RLZZ568_2363 [Cyanobacteriota bacterium]